MHGVKLNNILDYTCMLSDNILYMVSYDKVEIILTVLRISQDDFLKEPDV